MDELVWLCVVPLSVCVWSFYLSVCLSFEGGEVSSVNVCDLNRKSSDSRSFKSSRLMELNRSMEESSHLDE